LRASTTKEDVMSAIESPVFLRRALLLDAAASGLTALLMIVGAGALASPLGLSSGLIRGAGLVLVPYVLFVAIVATRAAVSRRAVRAVIAANAAWTAASVLLLGYVSPTMLGIAFVIGQALAVAALGVLQYVALRREQPAAA
jgi:hypothetical protein